ncbi:MAG: cysteine-rich CWC family protein [Proteobacteria bacterium]|nr:cysteine-rich CWC family protein [Pseudomonadota bacterium]
MPTPPTARAPVDVDPARCPLCGQGNGCAEEAARATGQPQPPCWCMTADFPPLLRDAVPEAARGRACICARCAAAAVPASTHALP